MGLEHRRLGWHPASECWLRVRPRVITFPPYPLRTSACRLRLRPRVITFPPYPLRTSACRLRLRPRVITFPPYHAGAPLPFVTVCTLRHYGFSFCESPYVSTLDSLSANRLTDSLSADCFSANRHLAGTAGAGNTTGMAARLSTWAKTATSQKLFVFVI